MGAAPASRPRWALWIGAFGAGVALALAIALALRDHSARESRPAPVAVQDQPSDRPAPVTATSVDRPLPPSGTLELARADFSWDGPVRVSLGLVEPSADAEPRPVRMFSQTDLRGIE